MQYFWTNTIWYIVLGVITLGEVLYVLIKGKDRKTLFALFLTFAGMAYFIEILILLVFKGYDYYPKIFDHINKIDDSIIGNTFSQFSIAATALLISFLKLKKYWYAVIALAYGGIEELFLYLGIYRHYWYSTWMTLVGFTILLWIMNKIYQKTFRNPGRVFQYFLTLPAVYTAYIHPFMWPFRLSGYPAFNFEIFPDYAISVAFYNIVQFAIVFNAVFIAIHNKFKWYFHALVILGLYLLYFAANWLGFIVYDDAGMVLLYATAAIAGMYISVLLVRKLYGFHKGEHPPQKAGDPKPMY